MVTLQTGQWFTPIFDGFDPSNTNTIGGRPDRIAGASLYPANQSINNWFNVAAFRIPGCPDNNPVCDSPANIGRFGNSGINILRTPAMKNLDLALMKEFQFSRAQDTQVPGHFLGRLQSSQLRLSGRRHQFARYRAGHHEHELELPERIRRPRESSTSPCGSSSDASGSAFSGKAPLSYSGEPSLARSFSPAAYLPSF